MDLLFFIWTTLPTPLYYSLSLKICTLIWRGENKIVCFIVNVVKISNSKDKKLKTHRRVAEITTSNITLDNQRNNKLVVFSFFENIVILRRLRFVCEIVSLNKPIRAFHNALDKNAFLRYFRGEAFGIKLKDVSLILVTVEWSNCVVLFMKNS